MLEPPPRHDVPETLRTTTVHRLRRELSNWAWVSTIPFTMKSPQLFHESTYDGIHVKQEAAQEEIASVVQRMGVELQKLDPSNVRRTDWVLGPICYKCGHPDFRQTHECDDSKPCTRCLKRGHHPVACPSRIQMCTYCHRRGHGEAACFRR